MESHHFIQFCQWNRSAHRLESLCIPKKPAPAGYRLHFLLICLMLLPIFAGCAVNLPTEVHRSPTSALAGFDTTATGRLFEKATAQHPEQSGFALIHQGRAAFTGRIAMTVMAEKSLDLQYYIWEPDTTGYILAYRLLEAADRGVRVRILLDDNNISGKSSPIAALDAHPNIEIRIFNPFAYRASRFFGYLTDFARLNHRMHNKLMVADNAVAIIGGRNIGNHYFGVHTEANFRDLDIAAAGPIVRDLSDVFDRFWNGKWSYPIVSLTDQTYTEDDLRNLFVSEGERIGKETYPYPLDEDVESLTDRLAEIRDSFVWAPGEVIWDDSASNSDGTKVPVVKEALRGKVKMLKKELLIESAYFVMQEQSLQMAKALHDKGVRIRVLTNSLTSTDVVAAHAGYAKCRERLIENGVEVYELRSDSVSRTVTDQKLFAGGTSKAALHTKAIVFDREAVFIGSFNLDPRSANINTEIGLYVESPELARQVIAYMDEGVLPQNSYRVEVNVRGDLVWSTEKDGEPVVYSKEPESDFWQRFTSGFIKLLPIEGQL